MQTLQIGPLALPYATLVALAALGLGGWIGARLGQRARIDAEPLLWRMGLVGLVVARLAFVLQWRGAYFDHPLTILDIRDGGWDPALGVVGACLYGLQAVRDRKALRRPVMAAVLTGGLAWALGTFSLLALGPSPSAPLPQLALPALDGRTVALSDFAGKPTVINLWASWCPPCHREMPVLLQAQQSNPDLNFVFVNQGEPPATIARYLERQGLPLRNVLVDERLQAGAAFGQRALPTTLFLDAQGRIVSTRAGELSHATLAQRLAELRAGTPSPP